MIDKWTKVALWIIALGIWATVMKPLIVPHKAKADGETNINISSVGGRPVYGEIPVMVKK